MTTTINEAKKIVKGVLEKHGFGDKAVTAKMVSFQDLARDECIEVTIYGWKPSGKALDIKNEIRDHNTKTGSSIILHFQEKEKPS